MATTGTERGGIAPTRSRLRSFLLVAFAAACAAPPPPEPSPPVIARPAPQPELPRPDGDPPRDPVPDTAVAARKPAPAAEPPREAPAADIPVRVSGVAPEVRVGLAVGSDGIAVGGTDAVQVEGAGGNFLGVIPAGEQWRAAPGGAGVVIRGPRGGRLTDRRISVKPRRNGEHVRAGTRTYRGTLLLVPDRSGITAINLVGLEEYLVGVVAAEMGSRPATDREALRAQAVVARTYALRNRNRWRAQGFDYYATVADQVYTGMGAENELAREAVDATRGVVVTFAGAPIDAFFYSTCGGRTELGTEVFRAADRPYLQSVPDVDPTGIAYCSISPRYRWTETWTGSELRRALARGLADIDAAPPSGVSRIRDIRIASRTASGRVGRLMVSVPGHDIAVESPRVRQALRSPSGEPLRSTLFNLRVTGGGSEVTSLTVEGSGAGHGVGFCQWGAIGRARAGQDYREIVSAYFPGTRLERFY